MKGNLSTDTAGIDDAIARVCEIANRLNNVPKTAGSGATGNDTVVGPRTGIDSGGVLTSIAGNRITSRQKADIIRRLEELKSLLDKMKSGKDHKSKIRMLVDSFHGAETAIRTFLLASQFIALIMSR
jgi:hypothetical protein